MLNYLFVGKVGISWPNPANTNLQEQICQGKENRKKIFWNAQGTLSKERRYFILTSEFTKWFD